MTRLGSILLFACTWLSVAKLCAEDTRHWGYQVPKRAALPAVRRSSWPRTAIDYFVLSRLESAALTPSEEAAPAALARRATLDLTGLPPALVDLDAYLADRSPAAYDKLVERLLANPHYGERMSQYWMDAARYADTHGYLIDAHREMWRWRDWVIDAFNENMPFDQFTIEQLAGDLIPGGTTSQRIASGFNRNHMINYENGAIAEQYRAQYVADRVVTMGTVWLGQTFDCARCHDHKYDPFTTREFYELSAFFNNVPEEGLDGNRGNAVPTIIAPTEQQEARWKNWTLRISALEVLRATRRKTEANTIAAWETNTNTGRVSANPLLPDTVLHLPFDQLENHTTAALPLLGKAQKAAVIQGDVSSGPGKIGQALLFDGDAFIDWEDTARESAIDDFSISLWVFPTTRDRMSIASFRDAKEKQGIHLLMEEGRIAVEVQDKRHPTFEATAKTPLELRRW